MKKVIAANLLIIVLLLISCRIWDEDSTVGSQTCDRYDQAVAVGFSAFATTIAVDSVQFFMNGIQVCNSHEKEIFRNNRGSQGFQGSLYNNHYERCVKNCYSSLDSIVSINTFGCGVGTTCDNFEGELSNFLIKIYSPNTIDSILLTRNGLAQMAYNKAYRIFPKSDSTLMNYFEEDHFAHIGCQGDFCLAEHSTDSLLCIDSHSDSPKKEFKNTCEDYWSGLY
ncbi:MAG TPA: hypothetical protein GX724_06455 [Fibrobacter sp.]|nr:hypothetical protein [Fibrobacter sp.]